MICFHNPKEENGYLSNWYMSKFIADNIEFTSMEQYMMYQKALTFHDYGTANEILNTDDVAVIKALGRTVKNYDDDVWDEVRYEIVYEGLVYKFEYDDELRKKLLSTGKETIVECAVHDTIWGNGLSMKSKDRFDKNKWLGRNLLGTALMEVREYLRRS